MKRKLLVELFEEHECVNFYTFRYVSDEKQETIKFIEEFNTEANEDDFDIISYWINKIGQEGADDMFFRPEIGKMVAMPVETSNLRLYCFKICEGVVLLGGGGIKTTATFNEDPILNSHAMNVRSVGLIIDSLIKSEKVHIHNNLIYSLKEITIEAV